VDLLGRERTSPSGSTELLARAGRWYTQLSILSLNTIILLIIITLLAYVYYGIRHHQTQPVYSAFMRPRAMHRMSAEQAAIFFKAFDRMGEAETYIYQPWVGFSERVFHSERLNVDEAMPMPTRRTWQNSDRGERPPLVIWTFGGSTMFGWGVPDDETIASHLAKTLARTLPERSVTVINYGHSYFFSSQELALFQTLLRRGERCDFAVFLDGLNDAFSNALEDVPAFNERMRSAFEKEQRRNPTAETYIWISPEFPPLKLLASIQRRVVQRRIAATIPLPTYDPVRKYQLNMAAEAALGSTQGIKTLFFWQPVPGDPHYAPQRELAGKIRQSVHSNTFHFVADLFSGIDPAEVYVDYHHYGDTACERVAEVIAREIVRQIPTR
jgi:hypothetical protein